MWNLRGLLQHGEAALFITMQEISRRDLFVAHALSGLTPAFVELVNSSDNFKENIRLAAASAIALAKETIEQLDKNEILPTKVYPPACGDTDSDSVT